MNRIDELFQRKKNNILSVYFTAGFPNLSDTVPVIQSLEKNGVELIEIGIPFSDPLVLMGYLNPILQFGFNTFCSEAQRCGIDGIIIPDLPFAEYMREYKAVAEKHGLRMIMLITPETSEERIRLIDKNTGGFIYMVSSASVTGAKTGFGEDNLQYFKRVNAMNLRNPRLIGFGISNKITFDAACEHASGAIIGSKFVSLLGSEKSVEAAVQKLKKSIANY